MGAIIVLEFKDQDKDSEQIGWLVEFNSVFVERSIMIIINFSSKVFPHAELYK